MKVECFGLKKKSQHDASSYTMVIPMQDSDYYHMIEYCDKVLVHDNFVIMLQLR